MLDNSLRFIMFIDYWKFFFILEYEQNISQSIHRKKKIEADGGKLLYFQTPEYYQQLESLSGLIAKY